MAIGWLSVLQAVPWSDVIANAPKVAEGARKLWNTVARQPVPDAADIATQGPTTEEALSPHAQALAALEGRVAAMEATTEQLHAQLLASSELIKALAEQNAQLVQRIEANRARVAWLTWVAVIGAGLSLVGLALAWTSRLA